MVVLADAFDLYWQPSIKFEYVGSAFKVGYFGGPGTRNYTWRRHFFCLLCCYILQFGNCMMKFEENAVSFAVEECIFVSMWQRVSGTRSFILHGGFLKLKMEAESCSETLERMYLNTRLHKALRLVKFIEYSFKFYKTLLLPDWKDKILSAFGIIGFFFSDHIFHTVPSIQCPRSSVSVIETINQSGNNPPPLLISLQSKLWFSAVLFDFSQNRSQFYSFRFSLLLIRLRMKRTKWCEQFRFNFSLLSIK